MYTTVPVTLVVPIVADTDTLDNPICIRVLGYKCLYQYRIGLIHVGSCFRFTEHGSVTVKFMNGSIPLVQLPSGNLT